MKASVGYLFNYSDGLRGERGVFYDYILAANGLFIQAANPMLTARVPVAECDIRGLAPLKPKITLTYGSIPQRFFDLALDTFLSEPDKESYVAVTAAAGYHFYMPPQNKEAAKVTYDIGDSVVLDIHSHANMPAFFSHGMDDVDETGLQLYAVVGKLREQPIVQLRAGVYGYFWPLLWKDVFDGTLYGAKEFEEEGSPIEIEATVKDEHDISGKMWWSKWFK